MMLDIIIYYIAAVYITIYALSIWELIYIRKLYGWFLRVEKIRMKMPILQRSEITFPRDTITLVEYELDGDKPFKVSISSSDTSNGRVVSIVLLALAWAIPPVVIWNLIGSILNNSNPKKKWLELFKNEIHIIDNRRKVKNNLDKIIAYRQGNYRDKRRVERKIQRFASPQPYNYINKKRI